MEPETNIPSSLSRETARRARWISEFRSEHAEIWRGLDELVAAVYGVIRTAGAVPALELYRAAIVVLWNKVLEYEIAALFLILSKSADQALAAQRLATEVALQCARIGESEDNFLIWQNKQERADEYRQKFEFVSSEGFLAQLMEISSAYGMHGHQTAHFFLEEKDRTIIDDQEYVVVGRGPKIITSQLQIWVRGFVGINLNCANALGVSLTSKVRNEVGFIECIIALADQVLLKLDSANKAPSAQIAKLEDFGYILDAWRQEREDSVESFCQEQQTSWEAIEAFVEPVEALVALTQRNSDLDHRMFVISMLWDRVLEYQIDAIELVLARELDVGYALMRMAAEVVRDCCRIAESDENYRLWRERESLHDTPAYKSIFCFKRAGPEKSAFELYNKASYRGVHSTGDVDRELRRFGIAQPGQLLEPVATELEQYEAIKLWLTTFGPMHECFVSIFESRCTELVGVFREMCAAFDPVLKQFAQNLGKMKSEANNTKPRS